MFEITRQVRIQLDHPFVILEPVHRGLINGAGGGRIGRAGNSRNDARAADARAVHGVEVAVRRFVVHDGDAARGRAARLYAKQRGAIVVRSIDAGRHDDDALHVQSPVQRRHFRGLQGLRYIQMRGRKRKYFWIAVKMRVAIAGVRRDFKIHRRGRLSSFSKATFRAQQNPRGNRSRYELASRQHSFLPDCLDVSDLAPRPGAVYGKLVDSERVRGFNPTSFKGCLLDTKKMLRESLSALAMRN